MTVPPKDQLTICFAHVAYQLQPQLERRNTGLKSFQVRSPDQLDARIGEADVLVVSGLWRDELLERGRKLRFIQSIGAGVDQFPKALLAERGIRLASARDVNLRAVSEHAMALILALSRRLPEARDHQAKHDWRGMIGDLSEREDELGGKTLIIIGLGGIGGGSPLWPRPSISRSSVSAVIPRPARVAPIRSMICARCDRSCRRRISWR
jgi:D-2-hydroxyacid dehydrogenase (NADP+)